MKEGCEVYHLCKFNGVNEHVHKARNCSIQCQPLSVADIDNDRFLIRHLFNVIETT